MGSAPMKMAACIPIKRTRNDYTPLYENLLACYDALDYLSLGAELRLIRKCYGFTIIRIPNDGGEYQFGSHANSLCEAIDELLGKVVQAEKKRDL